ncbi:MAG: hypothetical protein R8G34_17570 [Paracoccaceae bacterium]|nr:hypothetical protein [Paracoccaceae bacterium]
MTQVGVKDFFETMARSFMAGEYEAVASTHVYPGAVYIDGEVIVLADDAAFLRQIKDQCRKNYEMGVRRVKSHVVAQSLSRANNYSVWVMWQHFGAGGELLSTTNARYICRDNALGAPQIQLVEFIDVPACYSAADLERMTALPHRTRGTG